jgi:glutaredoxin
VPSVAPDRRTGRGRVRSANNDHGFPAEEIKAAQEFLAELPMPFACGLVDQRKNAPLLLETIKQQGWELGPELARALTDKPADGLDSPTRALKARFGMLPRRAVVLRDSAPALDTTPRPENPCPNHPRLEAAGCPQCAADHEVDRQRRVLDAERGIDDESARQALAALIQRGQKPRSAADRSRDAAVRQAEEARRQSDKRAEYLAG